MRIILIFTYLLCTYLLSLGQTKFHRDFTSNLYLTPSEVLILADNSVVLAFNFDDPQIFRTSTELVKLNVQGDTIWTKTYQDFSMNDLIEAHDGFLLVGSGIIKIDMQGGEEWQASYGVSWKTASQDADTGYMLAGSQVIAHIDSVGNIQWEKDIPYFLNKIIRSSDGKYAGIGNDNHLVRFDESGNSIGTSTLAMGNGWTGRGNDLIQGPDSSFYFCGTLTRNGIYEAYLAKSDPNGHIDWVSHGGLDTGQDERAFGLASPDGLHIYMTGFNGSFMGGVMGRNPYLLQVDNAGNPVAIKSLLWGGSGYGLAISPSGNIWLSGQHHVLSQVATFLVSLTETLSSCTSPGTSFYLNRFSKDSTFTYALSVPTFGLPLHLTKSVSNYQVTIPQSTQLVCSECTSPEIPSFGYTISNREVSFSDSSEASIEWFWDFGDGNSSNQQNPTYTYSSSGSFEICLTVSNTCGMSTFCDSLHIGSTSLDIEDSDFEVSISPNPFTQNINLDISSHKHESYQMSMLNFAGEEVLFEKTQAKKHALNLDFLPSGIYFLHIKNDSGSFTTRKIIKQ